MSSHYHGHTLFTQTKETVNRFCKVSFLFLSYCTGWRYSSHNDTLSLGKIIIWAVLIKPFYRYWMFFLCLCFFSSSVWDPVFLCGSKSGSFSQLDSRTDWCGAFFWLLLCRLLGLRWLQIHCPSLSRPAFHVWGNYILLLLLLMLTCLDLILVKTKI